MLKEKLFGLLFASLFVCAPVVAADCYDPASDEDICAWRDETTRSHCDKCKTFSSLRVCGCVTAECFKTPTGRLFNGLRNYGVLSNTAAVTTGNRVLWLANGSGSVLSSGISVNTSNGYITLPTSGLFLVQYTARFNKVANQNQSVGTVRLQQSTTVGGAPANITAPAIISTTVTDTASAIVDQTQVTGFALIAVTSSANNVIALGVTLANGMSIPLATSPDANAQLTILQLN